MRRLRGQSARYFDEFLIQAQTHSPSETTFALLHLSSRARSAALPARASAQDTVPSQAARP